MAPTQQRARKQGVTKQVTRKTRSTRQASIPLQARRSHSRGSDIENEDPSVLDDDDDDDAPLAIEQAPAADDSVLALQEMADRLGREVESFAMSLDRFLDELRPDEAYDAAHDMVLGFKEVALARVTELEAQYARERREELRREWVEQAELLNAQPRSVLASSLQARSITSASVKKLRRYQEEADTWELFRIVLEQHYRSEHDRSIEKKEKLAKLETVNFYTSESALYDRFLVEDSLGLERASIKSWLEGTADHQLSDIGDITKELEKKLPAGSGLWKSGWLNTRERIKGEKRMRTWPAPDSSPLPQLRSVETNELLVTSLDPDASARQGRTLEQQDEYFERAMWITCWEMLRRGTSWSTICDWCETQKEGWRAVAIGRGMVMSDAPSLANWRRMCFLASQSECSNEYEAAIYGLLGGNVAAIQPVCKTVDDHLFAFYSVELMHQFERHLHDNHPNHSLAPRLLSSSAERADPAFAQQEIVNLITRLRLRSDTRAQCTSPLKVVQSYLLGDEGESLIHTVGVAIGTRWSGTAIAAPRQEVIADTQPEADAAADTVCLRVITHICVILQVLRNGQVSREDQEMEDNLIASYIDSLAAAGKRELIPLYAARMQPARYIASMAIVLPTVSSSQEKRDLVALMTQKEMIVADILDTMLRLKLDVVTQEASQTQRFTILKNTANEIWPGQIIDTTSFPDTASSAQEAIVPTLEWYLLLPGEWDSTFSALTRALRAALVSKSFVCARLIIEAFKSQKVAQTKSYQVLGRTMHLFDSSSSAPADHEEAATWAHMQKRAKTYFDLEQLIDAFEALLSWRTQEQQYLERKRNLTSVPQEMKAAFQNVVDAMEPILEPAGFLLDAIDEEEAQDLAEIRRIYVTEAIIAYNTVLHSAGALITRDNLLMSLELATVVATETTNLTETFTDAKRMRELVNSFAATSKRILVLKNQGKTWKPKNEKRKGQTAAIWDISRVQQPNRHGAVATI